MSTASRAGSRAKRSDSKYSVSKTVDVFPKLLEIKTCAEMFMVVFTLFREYFVKFRGRDVKTSLNG